MPSTEAYIGSPEFDEASGQWRLSLDDKLQESLDGLCELVTGIYEAQACFLFAKFPNSTLLISNIGDQVHSRFLELQGYDASQVTEELVDERDETVASSRTDSTALGKHWRVTSPVIMPSGLHFGWLVFFRRGNDALSSKDKAVLGVAQRDLTNHLLHYKQAFQIEKARGLQSLITEQNDDWIFVKDEEFRIVYANNAFLSVYPSEMRDRIIGFTTVEEYEEDEAELFLAQDRLAFETGISQITEELHMPDGSHRIVDTVKRRFHDDNGNPYLLCICRDNTEREDLIRELTKANEELGHFTSVASHDLKSPLNAIQRLLEWIEEDCKSLLPEEHVDNMRLASERARRLQRLLDDLLSYAKIGDEDVTPVSVDLKEFVADLAQLLDIPDSVAISVADGVLQVPAIPFKTVMLNLIGNAVKHNDKENGVIDVELDASRHFYIIKVSDNGPGIDTKYFERIFQPFQTLKPRDEVEGSGIGLSVVMKHVRGFGGRIEVSSDGKSGSTFTVYWPKRSRKHG